METIRLRSFGLAALVCVILGLSCLQAQEVIVLVSPEEAISRVTADQLDELLHPILDPAAEKVATRSDGGEELTATQFGLGLDGGRF